MEDTYIIRVGIKSSGVPTGNVNIEVMGCFSREDAQDALSMLQLAAKSVQRQINAAGHIQKREG